MAMGKALLLFTIILQFYDSEGSSSTTVSYLSSSISVPEYTSFTTQTGIYSSASATQANDQPSGSSSSTAIGFGSSLSSTALLQLPNTTSALPNLSSAMSNTLSSIVWSQSSDSVPVTTSSAKPSSSGTVQSTFSSQSASSVPVTTSSVKPSSSGTVQSIFTSQSASSVQVTTSSVKPSSSGTVQSIFSSQSASSVQVTTSSVVPSTKTMASSLPSSLHSNITPVTTSLAGPSFTGMAQSSQSSTRTSMATSSVKSSSLGASQAPSSFVGKTSSLSSTYLSTSPHDFSLSTSNLNGRMTTSMLVTSSVQPVPYSPTPGSKKFTFSFKITSKVCSIDIRENNVLSSDYKSLAESVLNAVNSAYRNDPYYRGSKILYFDCGSVIPFVEISKNASATDSNAIELKPISDMVATGSVATLTVDSTSFIANPSKSVPNLYVTLDTELSNRQFCDHKANFKTRFASIMVTKDGQSFIDPSQIVIFNSNCNDQSALYSAAKISFYITASPSQVLVPDSELTIRAYKLIKQFIEDGTTWRLSASFDNKVKSVELAGKDKVEDTAYSELTIVLIGMGTTLALLAFIIMIIVVLVHLRKKVPAVTIPNRLTDTDNDTAYQYSLENEGFEKTEINIDGHDYEYPSGPDNEAKPAPQQTQNAYQELHSTQKVNGTSPPALYQPLSVEEEQRATVIVEPEEPTGYVVAIANSSPEAKDLTAGELALRKEEENQLKFEFESLKYDMPSSNIYSSSLTAKNRESVVIPKPETRVLLRMQDNNPDSEYINANCAMDTHHNKKYIITQGPLQRTTDDFWCMIVEQNVNVICMLTPLVQEGMEKCYQYWPPDSVPRQYGDIEVHLSKKELKPDFTVTTMETRSKNGLHEVVLFRYMTWPENGIPESSRSFVNFLLEAQKANEGRGGSPMVVLCSNGIGMSGVFVAVANGIESFIEKKAVDVYSIANGVRRDRAGAIQHFEQYKFIYQALHEYTLKFQDGKDPFANQANVTSTF